MSRVTVSIPSTESIVSDKKTHTVYNVECSESGYFWSVKRRYSEFAKLQASVKKQFPNLETPEFPSKAISSLRDDVIEQRRILFETYLSHLGSNPEVSSSETFRNFLSPDDQISGSTTRESSAAYRFSSIAGSNPAFRIAITGSKLLSSQGQNKYTSYSIRCENNGHIWTISKRFSQFDDLRTQLINSISKKISKFAFPSKKLFGNNTSSDLVKNRMILLNKFLQECLSDPEIAFSHSFIAFLNPKIDPSAESITSASHVGYLNKLGHVRKNWKKRWFILHEKNLYYYINPADIAPKGSIPLEGILISKCPAEKSKRKYTFELGTPSKTYLLQGCTSDDVDNWINALTQNKKKYVLEPDFEQKEVMDPIFPWLPAKSGLGMLGQSGIFGISSPYVTGNNNLATQHGRSVPGSKMNNPLETQTHTTTSHPNSSRKPNTPLSKSKSTTSESISSSSSANTPNKPSSTKPIKRKPKGRKPSEASPQRFTDSQIVDDFLDRLVLVVDDEDIPFNDTENKQDNGNESNLSSVSENLPP